LAHEQLSIIASTIGNCRDFIIMLWGRPLYPLFASQEQKTVYSSGVALFFDLRTSIMRSTHTHVDTYINMTRLLVFLFNIS